VLLVLVVLPAGGCGLGGLSYPERLRRISQQVSAEQAHRGQRHILQQSLALAARLQPHGGGSYDVGVYSYTWSPGQLQPPRQAHMLLVLDGGRIVQRFDLPEAPQRVLTEGDQIVVVVPDNRVLRFHFDASRK